MSRQFDHHAPLSTHDFDFFFLGLEEGKLMVQRCGGCGRLRNPPAPMCASCHSLEFEPVTLAGTGEIYSYTVHHHPPLPSFPTPHVVIVVAMDEGVRVVADLAGVEPGAVRIGQRVRTEFYRRGDLATFRFKAQS